MSSGEHFLICPLLKFYLKNTDVLCYQKFVFVLFDLLSNLHDQNEYDNYFVINREAYMLETLKIKNKIICSLVIHVAKQTWVPHQQNKQKRNRGAQPLDNHPTQGYNRTRNSVQMASIINMVRKQYN